MTSVHVRIYDMAHAIYGLTLRHESQFSTWNLTESVTIDGDRKNVQQHCDTGDDVNQLPK